MLLLSNDIYRKCVIELGDTIDDESCTMSAASYKKIMDAANLLEELALQNNATVEINDSILEQKIAKLLQKIEKIEAETKEATNE